MSKTTRGAKRLTGLPVLKDVHKVLKRLLVGIVIATVIAVVATYILWTPRASSDRQFDKLSTTNPEAYLNATDVNASKDTARSLRTTVPDTLTQLKTFLSHLALQTEPDLGAIDDMTSRFLKDDKHTRGEKLSALVDYLRANCSRNTLATKYVCDMLDFLGAFESAQELISIYHQTPDRELRMELTEAMQHAAVLSDEAAKSLSQDDLATFASGAEAMQRLFRAEIASNDPEIAAASLAAFTASSSPEASLEVLNEVLDKWLAKADAGTLTNLDVPHTHLLQQILDVAIANGKFQDEVLPSALELANQFPADSLGSFHRILCEVASDADLTSGAKETLRTYLESHAPLPSNDSSYYNWLKGKVRVSSGAELKASDFNRRIVERVVQEDNPLNRASVVVYADDELLKAANPQELQALLQKSNADLASSTTPETRGFIDAARERLEVLVYPRP